MVSEKKNPFNHNFLTQTQKNTFKRKNMETAIKKFDIRPFALPNTPANEVWFEQPRDITEVTICLLGQVPAEIGLSYRKKHWPQQRFELGSDLDDPGSFGWKPLDDWFNGEWKVACYFESPEKAIQLPSPSNLYHLRNLMAIGVAMMFKLSRTMAIRLDGFPVDELVSVAVHTRSPVLYTPAGRSGCR